MKKIPLHIIIFFYLSLVPVVLSVSVAFMSEGGIFSVFLLPIAFIYIFPDINSMILTLVVVFLQICAIVNYIDAYKQVHSYNCELYNKNKILLWTVKFADMFFMMCGFTLYSSASLKYVIFSPETLILTVISILSIRIM